MQYTIFEQATLEGKQEQIKEETKNEEYTKQKMEILAKKANIILLQKTTVFPFDFFPSTLLIDTTKINIIHKSFFATEYIETILLKDLTDIAVERFLFLANLKFIYCHHPMRPMQTGINLLMRKDALQAKNILEGILVIHREHIDLTKIDPDTIISFVKNLGSAKINT